MDGPKKGMTMRLDDEDIIVKPRAEPRRSSFELLGILTLGVLFGTLAADGVRLLIVNAWAQYQLEQLNQQVRQASIEARHAAADQKAQAIAEQLIEERERKLNSNECRFWMEMHNQNPGHKTQNGISKNCY